MSAAVQRLDALQITFSPYQDPFQKPEPPFLLFGLGVFLLLGIGAALGLFSDVLKDVLKEETLKIYRSWIDSHLLLALGPILRLGRWPA